MLFSKPNIRCRIKEEAIPTYYYFAEVGNLMGHPCPPLVWSPRLFIYTIYSKLSKENLAHTETSV